MILFSVGSLINFAVVQYNILRKVYFLILAKYVNWAGKKEKKMDEIISCKRDNQRDMMRKIQKE